MVYVRHPIVIGLQYGDEGKGKVTDFLAEKAEWVIRYNGGNNAGHTLTIGSQKVVTHSIPSGIMYAHAKNYIGSGCVVDPKALLVEIADVQAAGALVTKNNFLIDYRAHITLPIHLALDKVRESGVKAIGSTLRGIGPVYSTKADRTGLRMEHLLADVSEVEDRLEFLCKNFNPIIKSWDMPESTFEENLEAFMIAKKELSQFVSSDSAPFYDVAKDKKCLMEGAQAVLLDIDHGFYPFVTSSHTIGSYAAVGGPFPYSRLGDSIGVFKAYLTRVGDGPMPTELKGELGEKIRKLGGEFGATTGRPRKTGWLDLDDLLKAVRVSDCTKMVMTKGDVLDGFEKVSVKFEDKLVEFDGWPKQMQSTDKTTDECHPNFAKYVAFIEEKIGVDIVGYGLGAGREEMHWCQNPDTFWSK